MTAVCLFYNHFRRLKCHTRYRLHRILISPRTGYNHHAIYTGNHNVIHYTGFGYFNEIGKIEEISLEQFLDGHGYYVLSHSKSPYSPQEIINRAYSRLGEQTYSVWQNNCEHFCNWCVYNQSQSPQINSLERTIEQLCAKPITPLLAVGLLSYGICKLSQ